MVSAIANPVASPGAAPASTSGTSAAATAASANFDTFLKMLTTQLKSQDPLNPMESSDFAVQLATFSGVEQQAQTNKLLETMILQTSGSLGQIADWIGKEVRTTRPVWFGNEPLTLDIMPDSRADSVTLITLSESGREVLREEIGPGEGQIDWLGRDELGQKLADGRYSFVIESSRAGEVIAQTSAGAYVRVAEAEVGPQGIELIFQGGGSALASEIEALREPD